VTFEHFSQNVTDAYKETILPGAKELLTFLNSRVHLGVLTGNYEKIAWHKLELVGLRDFFSFGLFGHEAEDRNSLARLVLGKAKKHFHKDFLSKNIFFIGDTPKDIACAREIDAKVIAVTTGKYTKNDLELLKPDLLVSSLLDEHITDFILSR
jgi:phosphoglycolate phosphatase-like HAD superfamily hydrolase